LLGDGRASPLKDTSIGKTPAQEQDLFRGARIVLLDGPPQRLVVPVKQDRARHHPTDTETCYFDTGRGKLATERAYVGPPLAGILLGPTRVQGVKAGDSFSLCDDSSFRVKQQSLGRGCADVDAKEQSHVAAAWSDSSTRASIYTTTTSM
jgi:hypothetical protein